MPRQSRKLGYNCPNCGLDFGCDEAVSPISARRRGQITYVLSRRRGKEERIHFKKLGSMAVESELKNLLMDGLETPLLNFTADLFMKSLNDGIWALIPVPHQELILKGIAEMKRRAESSKEAELHVNIMYEEWNLSLTKEDSPYYELARKLSRGRISNDSPDDLIEMKVNPAEEIMRYRRSGDPLLYLDTSVARQMRVLVKYRTLAQVIRNGPRYSLMEKGSKVLNRYSKPFSDKKWMYSWVEQFWIVLYAHAVSAREAARMVRAVDGQGMRKLSPRHIKNQIEPVIRFWLEFFEYVPHYLAYLNMIGWVIKNDPELSKLDQQESAQTTSMKAWLAHTMERH